MARHSGKTKGADTSQEPNWLKLIFYDKVTE